MSKTSKKKCPYHLGDALGHGGNARVYPIMDKGLEKHVVKRLMDNNNVTVK